MPLSVERMRRVEIWDTWQCDGGVRIAVVTDPTVLLALENVTGGDQLSLSIPITSAVVAELVQDRILRIDQDDTTFDEWKITSSGAGTETGIHGVTAAPFAATDFAKAGVIQQRLSDGTVLLEFEGVGLTPTDQLTQFFLPLLVAAGYPWVTIGTITPVLPVDVAYSWESLLSGLRRLADLTTTEVQLRRVGTTGYAIDLITEIGSGSPVSDIRSQKNLQALSLSISSAEQANRLYPKGAGSEDGSATMARATWQVAAIAGSVLTLADPAAGAGPLFVDDQLNGLYVRKVSGALTLVTDSASSTQTVTVASAAGIAVADLIQFRLNAAGDDLIYLESPIDAAGGIKSGVLELQDIPGTNNLVRNAATRIWPGSSSAPPSSWSVIGSPTITKQTAAPHAGTGGTSIRVQTTADGAGVRTASVSLFPTADNPYVSGYAAIWVVSAIASIRVELVFTTPTGTQVSPPLPKGATNSIVGQFEFLGVSGENALLKGATAVYLRVVQNGGGTAEFYVDSAQITETPSQQPFVEGSGGTQLWQAANEKLRTNGGALASFEANFVDLARLDPVTWGSDARIILGGRVRVKEPRLAVAIETRIIEVERNYLARGLSRATLSNKPDDLTGTLSRPKRAPSVAPVADLTTSIVPAPPELSYKVSPLGVIDAQVIGDGNTDFTRCIGSIVREPTGDELDATTASPSGQLAGIFPALVTVKAARHFWLAARAYNSAGEGSVVTRTDATWLGLDQTPGADVILGTILAQTLKLIYPVAFDDECVYCEMWIAEYTTNPGADFSVEGKTAMPFRTLSLGDDQMIPGVAKNISVPLAAQTNWIEATFVPFDALGKRGNIKIAPRTQGINAIEPASPSAAALSSTATSVTNRVTLALAVNGIIRAYMDGQDVGDTVVTVGGGAIWDITTPGLEPGSTHVFEYTVVLSIGESQKSNALTVTVTPSAGTIDFPLIASVSYNVGDQSFAVTITPGANAPADAINHVELSDDGATGWVEVAAWAYDIIRADFAQRVGATTTQYFRARASRTGWTTSAYSAVVSGVAPAA